MLLLSTRLSSIFSTHNLDRHSSILTRSKKARSQVNLKFETVIFTVIVYRHTPGRMRELSEEASTNSPNFARRPCSHNCVAKKREASCDSWWQFFYRTLHLSRAPHTPRHAISLCRVCSLCSENVVNDLSEMISSCPETKWCSVNTPTSPRTLLVGWSDTKKKTQRISFNIDIMPAQRRSPHCVGRNSIFQNFTLHFFPHCRLSTLSGPDGVSRSLSLSLLAVNID